MLREAEAKDREEDFFYWKGRRGDELPEEFKSRNSRLARLKESTRLLEEEAKTEARK